MGFFSFISGLPHYAREPAAADRMDRRHEMLIQPIAPALQGARVLDLAAHDGRWSYALARAGAAEVVGVEGRRDLIERFATFPDDDAKARVQLVHDDIFHYLAQAAGRHEVFDVVTVFGIFYHVMDHARLLSLIAEVQPRLVVVDSEFLLRPGPVIGLVRERTDHPLNAIPAKPGQKMRVKGVPSRAAMEALAEDAGFTLEWLDWDRLPPQRRRGVADYYRRQTMRRGSCILRPRLG